MFCTENTPRVRIVSGSMGATWFIIQTWIAWAILHLVQIVFGDGG